MSKYAIALLIVLSPISAASAQTMPVSVFLAKAEALKRKGMAAFFSSDVKLLKTEVANSGRALRAEEAGAIRAGHRAQHCMPANAGLKSDELIAYLNTIPPGQRNIPLVRAMASLMARKYPCRR